MPAAFAADRRPGRLPPPGLVWLASYPKSGNTWVRVLLSNLLSGAGRPEDINRLSHDYGIASGRGRFEAHTLLDSSLLSADEIDRLRPAFHEHWAARQKSAAIIKVHDAWTRLGDGTPLLGRAARAAVYLVRDPRDVAVSHACHQGKTLNWSIALLNNPEAWFGGGAEQLRQRLLDWSGHVRSWLDQAEVPVALVRYEDLSSDPVAVFSRVLAFLGLEFDPSEVGLAVRRADFAELQRQEREKDFKERRWGQSAFFRRGQVGDWRRHLSPEQVGAIERAHGAVMDRLGYQRITKETKT
jgi:hypothetical protein